MARDTATSPSYQLLTEMGRRMEAHDWAASPVGPRHAWPESLKTLVSVLLGSNQPMFVVWGEAQTTIYNDAYMEILGDKHPAALGRPFFEVWSEIRDALEPIVERVYGGEPVHMTDIELWMNRRGFVEETHFAFSYTPVFAEAGRVTGFFCACIETTAQVLGERRQQEETARQRRLFEQAPGFVAILREPTHTFEFVNESYRRLFGDRDFKGRAARDVFPELEGQGFFRLLDQVYATGERFVAHHMPVRLEQPGGGLQERFVDFIYEPVKDEAGRVTGIFCEGHDVTDAHAAQLALSASEARFRTALQIQTVGAIYFDMDGRLTDANDAFLRMSGYSREELERGDLTWQSLTPAEWMERSEQAFAELKARGETTPYEKEYIRKDGSRWWALFAAKLQPDGTGFEFVLDITDRKRAEAALRETETRFRTLADLSPDAIVINKDGRYVYANRAALRVYGVPRSEDLIGRSPSEFHPPEDYTVVQGRVDRLKRGEDVGPAEIDLVRPDGSRLHVETKAGLVEWEGGPAVQVLVRDVTERRAAEAALRESEEDYRHAAELNPQVAWTARPDGQLDRVAQRWMDWTGQTGLGSTYAEGLHPDDVPRTFEVWGRSVATGEPYDIVHRVRRRSGEFRWIRSRAFARRDAEGRIVRWYGTTEDIHEQKTAEDHLKLMVLELNHRVKNNLATVQAIAMQTLRGAENAQVREAFLNRISALAAAHDILTREQWEGAGVGEIAHGVLDALTGAAGRVRAAGPRLALSPKAALALSMAFHELGTNALKYGALSRPEGAVDLTWTQVGGDLELTWTERGGPPVTAPTQRGFGSRLLERGLAAELRGQVRLRYDPEGLVCSIRAPLAEPDEG
ncbi:PAS domain S-box protein [Phenylobacterium sp.]|jgi:PAS domain S-box-containing protein|uniref:PAS domain S-box protein n=1 Tax=Phenylobacterium sp. TaxID=1871053 RepID=UPI002F959295